MVADGKVQCPTRDRCEFAGFEKARRPAWHFPVSARSAPLANQRQPRILIIRHSKRLAGAAPAKSSPETRIGIQLTALPLRAASVGTTACAGGGGGRSGKGFSVGRVLIFRNNAIFAAIARRRQFASASVFARALLAVFRPPDSITRRSLAYTGGPALRLMANYRVLSGRCGTLQRTARLR